MFGSAGDLRVVCLDLADGGALTPGLLSGGPAGYLSGGLDCV